MNELLLNFFRVLIFLSAALLVIGILKPEWLCFRQKQPGRTTIIVVAIGILVIGFTGVGAIQYAGKNNAEAVSRGKTLSEAVYAIDNSTLRCESGAKPGSAGASTNEQTSAGIR